MVNSITHTSNRFGSNLDNLNFNVWSPNEEMIKNRRGNTPIGELHLSGRKISLTLEEVHYLIETLEGALDVFNKKYRMGR